MWFTPLASLEEQIALLHTSLLCNIILLYYYITLCYYIALLLLLQRCDFSHFFELLNISLTEIIGRSSSAAHMCEASARASYSGLLFLSNV